MENTNITKFKDLPLSKETQKGLDKSHYVELTDIQKRAIAPALKDKDILGSAPTGSGKTLAFLIPLVEKLYRLKWNREDGLGALIISPTRELALQIFKELKKVGRCHELSAGLIIGGKDVQTEAERLDAINILIATPGRLLQHMDQTPNFIVDNLQVLVLDEADRILDAGFKKTLDAILENLPKDRQTMLYSATQTQSVSDLARLSLTRSANKKPEYITTTGSSTATDSNEKATVVPEKLEQYYIITTIPDKISVLYSFLKTHLKSKIIVFFASSKQVRFIYETFRRLQPGIPLIQLHGKQRQQARIDATTKFSKSSNACLFATDIVARGLDFPTVDWVVQVDAPDDVSTYIHRVGRTARSNQAGKSLIFITPKEEEGGLVKKIELRVKREIEKLNVKESKRKSIQDKLQAMCFEDAELKYLGQRAFICYVRSIYLQHDKEVFNINDIPMEEFATSMGLPGAPKIKLAMTSEAKIKMKKNMPHALIKLNKTDKEGGEEEDDENKVRTRYDRMFERKNQNVLSEHYMKMAGINKDELEDDDEDDDFMKIKRKDHEIKDDDSEKENQSESESEGEKEENDDNDDDTLKPVLHDVPTSKRAMKRALSKKQRVLTSSKVGTKIKFDDEGNAHSIYELEDLEDFKKQGDSRKQIEEFISKEKKEMEVIDREDKEIDKTKRIEKKRRRKEFERLAMEREYGVEGGYDDDDEFEQEEEEAEERNGGNYEDDDENEDIEQQRLNRRERRRRERKEMGLEDKGLFGAEDEDEYRNVIEDPEEKRQTKRRKKDRIIEVEDPDNLKDLEALSRELLSR